MADKPSLSKEKAFRIISTLRKGTPPEEGVDLYSVGREDLISYFERKLTEIKDYGVSDVKLVSADWGHGKSHFLDLLRNVALAQGFVVSNVALHSKEAPFDQLPIVMQRIMANVATPKERSNGLESLLNDWSVSNKTWSEQDVFESLKNIGIDPDMRIKLVNYRRHYNHPGHEYQQCLEVLKWFEGKETKSKTFKSVHDYLHSLVLFIRSLGYGGFLVMLDEAEAITSLSRISRRDLANENIRQIIDNDQDTQGFYFVLASTPTFLSGEDERGAHTYPALWRRVSDALPGIRQDSLDKVIVDLPKLTEEQFVELARRIRPIYEASIGRRLTLVTDRHIRDLAHYVHTRTDQRVGTMVRSTVAVFDEATSAGFDFQKRFELIVENSMEQESRDRAQ